MIIALSGYARSGKDEAAKVLVEEFGFTRVAFADKLREAVYQLNAPVAFLELDYMAIGAESNVKLEKPTSRTLYVQDIIDQYGWDGYKETRWGPEIRRQLQRMGTEVGRNTLWDSIWIDAAFKPYEGKGVDIVVTDARFPNEAKAVFLRDGEIWRVNRAGIGPAVSPDGSIHPSETSLDNWPFDRVLSNDGSLEHYHDTIREAYHASRI